MGSKPAIRDQVPAMELKAKSEPKPIGGKSVGRRTRRPSGFTIIEAIIAMGIIGLTVIALFSGMHTVTFSVRMAQDNLRATEVMLEKMEGLRLYTWEQLLTTNFIPTNFTAPYYDTGATNVTDSTYAGTLVISPFPGADRSYSNDMRKVKVTINWTSGGIARTRTLESYIARYGIQNYVIQ